MAIIDLSLPLENGMPVYPGDVETSIQVLGRPEMLEEGWLAHWVSMSLHAGTHIEAPAHSIGGGKTLDMYPLDTFFGEATTITWKDIGHCNVETPIVFLFSGADKWWGYQKYFTHTSLTSWEAEWISHLNIRVLGLDIISAGNINIHRLLQIKDILLIEGMCNLEGLLYRRAKAYFFPLKLKNMEASPVRAVAEMS